MTSWMSTVNSTHEPRNGMIRAEISRWPFGWVDSSNTAPGDRCSWLDHDSLGAVDHERAERREQRQLAEVDFLLDDVARPLDPVDLLVDDELQRRLERRGVRHVALDALLDGVLRLAQRILHELQREVLVDVRDRKEILEDALEPDVLAVLRGRVELQQRFERSRLDVEEMRHSHPARQLGKRNLLDRVGHSHLTEMGRTPARARTLDRIRAMRGPRVHALWS